MAVITGLPVGSPVSDTDRSLTQLAPLGSRYFDALGNEYRYCKAQAAIAAKEAVCFNGSALGYDAVRKVTDVNEYVVGVANAAFAVNEYGLIQTHGVTECKVIVGTAAGSCLVSDATDGTLKLATEAESLGANRGAVALITGVAAGSTIFLG